MTWYMLSLSFSLPLQFIVLTSITRISFYLARQQSIIFHLSPIFSIRFIFQFNCATFCAVSFRFFCFTVFSFPNYFDPYSIWSCYFLLNFLSFLIYFKFFHLLIVKFRSFIQFSFSFSFLYTLFTFNSFILLF
jgi:hypothetical protein